MEIEVQGDNKETTGTKEKASGERVGKEYIERKEVIITLCLKMVAQVRVDPLVM